MRSRLELWRDIMVDGSKTPPRRQPRDTMTVKGQMYGILPAITRWVEGGRTSLVGVDTEDILAALPDDPSPRHTMMLRLPQPVHDSARPQADLPRPDESDPAARPQAQHAAADGAHRDPRRPGQP